MTKLSTIFSRYKWLLSDIRFWIVFFFVIRLIGITNAPLEMGHNWRQSLTAMIARNFYENGANLLYPVIDLAGEKTGIIGSEFPLFNYLIYLVAEVFGYQHWYGRLINLTVTSIGILYFYKALKGITTEGVAYFATLVLSVSIWFGFGRKIMPDTFSVALMLIGLFHARVYLTQAKTWSLLWFFIFSTLGTLCKIPALSLMSILGVALFIHSIPLKRTLTLFAVGTVSFALVCLWYFYWVPHLTDTYGYVLYFPRSLGEGLQEVLNLWPQLLEKFYFVAFSSFVAFAVFLAGCYRVYRDRSALQYHLIGAAIVSVVFIFFIIKTGIVFPLHSYYVVPYVPLMAAVAGYLLAHIKSKHAVWLTVIISIEAIGNHQDDMFLKEREMYKLTLDDITNKYIPVDSLIVINGTISPQHIYFAHRKGWTEHSDVIQREGYLDTVSQLGAAYLIWDKKQESQTPTVGLTLYQDEYYHIQKIKK